MPISEALRQRNAQLCELCNTEAATEAWLLSPKTEEVPAHQVALCGTCLAAMAQPQQHADYWRCLEGSIWSAEPVVQALSYRLLHSLQPLGWAAEVMQSVELDDNTVQWALSAFEVEDAHHDAYGNPLANGDTVVLTQALNVKGTSFSAAKGTVVKRIRLVPDNTGQIEGKINDQTIVILTKYVKKG